jgi:uncharacterized protein
LNIKYFFRHLFLSLALLATFILRGQPQVPERPSPQRLVNDFAKLLNYNEIDQLEKALVAYNDSTSNQVAIVTIPTLGDYAIEDWALEIGRKWGIGRKAKNNGVLVLVSLEPKKINISTGYGLEGALPDILCKRIITNEITPSFKQQQYYTGLDKGVKAIRKATFGEYKLDDSDRATDGGSSVIFFIFIAILILFIIFSIYRKNSRYAHYGNPNRRFNDNGGGGWIFWGGGFGGGGSDDSGGGFGGFGGGDFGGGGASGDW